MPDLIAFGSAVKVTADGKITGHLVRFSGPDAPDLDGEFFTADTDFGLDFAAGKEHTLPLYYSHGFNKHVGKSRIGWATVKMDDSGLFMEAELDKAAKYRDEVMGIAKKDFLGASSGAVAHLVDREEVDGKAKRVAWLKQWPLGEASLTVTPAEPRNVMTVKEYGNCYRTAESAGKYILDPSNPRGGTNASYRPRVLTDKSATMPADVAAVADDLVEEYFADAPVSLTTSALYSLDSCRTWGLYDILTDPRTSPAESMALALALINEHADLSRAFVEAVFAAFADEDEGEDSAKEFEAGVKSTWLSPAECAAGSGVPVALPLAEQTASVLAAVDSLKGRVASVVALRIKEGRTLSTANHSRLTSIAEKMGGAHDDMKAMLEECAPTAKPKAADGAVMATDEENRKAAAIYFSQRVRGLGINLAPA